MNRIVKAVLFIQLVMLSACAQSAHQSGQYLFDRLVPKDLRRQVDRNVSYSELQESPSTYEGRVVMLSGVVLNAKRTKEQRTEIEVLQVPSNASFGPSGHRNRSEGRFLAVQETGLDPAAVEEGTPVTVIGEVKGTATRSLDESTYTYPVLAIRQLLDWGKTMSTEYAGYGSFPFYGGYHGYYPYQYYPYWQPYGYAPYGFYPFGYGYGSFRSPAPAPSPPPSQSIPPQFKRDE